VQRHAYFCGGEGVASFSNQDKETSSITAGEVEMGLGTSYAETPVGRGALVPTLGLSVRDCEILTLLAKKKGGRRGIGLGSEMAFWG